MIISRTPFRISFFGGGTDYPVWYEKYGGAALSTTIDKYCYLMVRYYPPFFPIKYRIVYSKIESVNEHDEIVHPSVKATLKHLQFHDGVEIHNTADLPARSGLGSSSSFTVGLLHALSVLQRKEVTRESLGLDAIHIEQNLIKENVGSQDQVAVANGGFNFITFAPGNIIKVNPVQISQERIDLLNSRLMLFFTGFSRFASEVAAEWIKSAPKKAVDLHTMRKIVDEAVEILSDLNRNIDDFGHLLHKNWLLKRGLNRAVSTSQIDEIYDRARRAGAIGGKLLGAGQGGFMILYVTPELQAKVRDALKELLHVPFKFEGTGSQIIQSDAESAYI